MKSYHLRNISSIAKAREILDSELHGQRDPWLLCSDAGDPIAYFGVGETLDENPTDHVYADISGRHSRSDEAVLRVLEKLQEHVGGVVSCSP
jgi:hypothetical protein